MEFLSGIHLSPAPPRHVPSHFLHFLPSQIGVPSTTVSVTDNFEGNGHGTSQAGAVALLVLLAIMLFGTPGIWQIDLVGNGTAVSRRSTGAPADPMLATFRPSHQRSCEGNGGRMESGHSCGAEHHVNRIRQTIRRASGNDGYAEVDTASQQVIALHTHTLAGSRENH
jgi:hypothetical protein